MPNRFDVVVVPDFRGRARSTFEARTLFFLASWIENAGLSRTFPLHLACIGEPPPSVRWLAGKCNALVTVHAPLLVPGVKGFGNKLRGLELEWQTQKVLLLDADIVVLADLSNLSSLVEENSIGVLPENLPRVPDKCWPIIYSSIGLDLPKERSTSIEIEVGINRFGKNGLQKMGTMLPFYNSGIIFLPSDLALRDVWETHLRKIAELFAATNDLEWKKIGNEEALATAIEYLKHQGVRCVRLPDQFHCGWRHLYSRSLRLIDVCLLHMTGSFRNVVSEKSSFQQGIRAYQRLLLYRFGKVWWRSPNDLWKVADLKRRMLPALLDAYRLGGILQRLDAQHVSPALDRISN